MANRVINEILRQGQGMPRRYVLAALATGKVESNFRNLRYGDADSRGWRQERASLYRNPNNLRQSVARFYREAASLDRGQSAGRLAADVQRPAAQYRGRYAQVMGEAKQILSSGGIVTSGGGGGAPATSALPGALNVAGLLSTLGGGATQSRPTATAPAAPAFSAAAPTPQQYQPVQSDAQPPQRTDYASALQALTSAAAQARQTVTPGTPSLSGGGGGGQASVSGELRELFWNGPGAINYKDGRSVPKGFVSGHTDHVHVAGRQKAMVALGQMAQEMGLHVGENPRFGGVDEGAHVSGSYHGGRRVGRRTLRAIDVSGDARKMQRFAHLVAQSYGY